jgi:hypothetical protein
MDTGTLIKVVAMLDARIAELQAAAEISSSNAFDMGRESAFEEIAYELQKAIDADVAAMETSQGM